MRSIAVLAACHALQVLPAAGQKPGSSLAWPAADPVVRWEGETGGTEDLRRSGLLRKLTGKRPVLLFERPYGVALFESGVLITDPGARQVIHLSPNNQITNSLPGVFESPIGIAICADGIVVSDSVKGSVALLDLQLQLQQWIAVDLDRPTGVACSGNRIWISETGAHRIVVLEPEKEPRFLGRRGSELGEFNFPTSLATDGLHLWIADTLNFRVQRLDIEVEEVDLAFGQLGDAAGEMPRVKGLAVDAHGRLWLTDALLNQLSIFSGVGDFLVAIGQEGSAPAEFSFPAGVSATEDGRIVVVDSLNRRLQYFSLTQDRVSKKR